ncbi:uncharacterized protein N7503_004558 [Penicillium pulvis]|uniref:uncharacterized protein n=1 Tax=Penicillium pulvis TaxID=1562058 RepID=UPI0025466B35|nr:uncharacterized protein N7503_004558 [Penicillium pulvis]KAJ5802108.1 hypothetical protein N7503_004558 [Penicillium pulvis]
MRTAVALSKERQSSFLGPALGNLAALLLERFKSTGRDAGLDEAVQMTYWALDCLSDGDPDRALVLATLGIILSSQYDCLSRPQDLEDAIYSLQIALQTWSPRGDGTFPAAVSNNLACALGRRYEYTGRREDLNDAITSALEATQIELSDDPTLMAAVGSNLANLLARQYESIGDFDSLSNALFEARIVTEVAPELQQLDALLGHISGLAEGQHALRTQATTTTIKVSRWRYTYLLMLFLFIFLLPRVYPRSYYPLCVFLGGIMSHWAVRKYYQPVSSCDRRGNLFKSVSTWTQNSLCSPYDDLHFAPTVVSTPWIDISSTVALRRSEDEPYNGDKLRRQKSIHTRRVESRCDQRWRTGARSLTSTRDREDVPNDMDTLSRGVNQRHRTPLSHLSPVFTASRTKCNEDGLESQKQLTYDIRENLEARNLMFQSSNESECSVNLLSAPEKEERDTTFSTESTGAWDKQQPILDNAIDQEDKSPFTEVSSLKAGTGPLTTANQPHQSHPDVVPTEDALNNLKKDFNDKFHDLTPATKVDEESSSFEVVAQGNTSNDMNKNEGNAMGNIYSEEAHVVGHLSRHYGDRFETRNISATLHGHQNSGADRISPDATTKELHAGYIPQDSEDEFPRGLDKGVAIERLGDYQVVPQHRNSNDNHPDGLSPEPGVNRESFWGDSFDTMTWPGKLGSGSSSFSSFEPPVDFVASSPGAIPSKVPRKHRDRELSPPKPQIRQNRSYYDQLQDERKPSESAIDSDDAISGHPMILQAKRPTLRRAVTPLYSATSETADSSDFPSDIADNGRYYPSDERWPEKKKYRGSLRPKPPLERPELDDYLSSYSLSSLTAAQEQIKHSKGTVPIKPIASTKPERRNNGRTPAKVVKHAVVNPMPAPAPNLKKFGTSYEKVSALSEYFKCTILPLCDNYGTNLPADARKREFEYRQLSEIVLSQVILKADGIISNDGTTRAARRELIKEAESALNKIDAAFNLY